MWLWPLLLLYWLQFTVSGRFRVSGSTPGDVFLNELERQVLSIASQAVINDAMACSLVASCECSRGACAPLIEDFSSYECAFLLNNSACTSTNSQTCNSQRVRLDTAFVRTPTNDTDPLSIQMRNSICSQRLLDRTFLDVYKEQKDQQYFFAIYFGSFDGSSRIYPGQVTEGCPGYDPRVRPWYSGAISVVKDIVVLIDNGPSMGDQSNVSQKILTPLAGAQELTANLLNTLTQDDRVTVMTVSDSTLSGKSYTVLGDYLDTEDPLFRGLVLSVQNATVTNMTSSNTTAALMQTVPVFNSSKPGSLKIILLLTDGSSPSSLADFLPVIDQLQRNMVRLFVYQLGNKDATLSAVACEVEGYYEELSLQQVENPLSALRSYYSFLARSHISVSSNVFWQPIYTDYDSQKEIITVAASALSADGHLIGVAGIDVQVAGLDRVDQQLVESSLAARSNGSFLNTRATINECSVTKATELDCGNSSIIAICPQTDTKHSHKDLVCCQECGGLALAASNSSPSRTIIIIAVVCAVAAFSTVLGILFSARRSLMRLSPLSKPRIQVGDTAFQRTASDARSRL